MKALDGRLPTSPLLPSLGDLWINYPQATRILRRISRLVFEPNTSKPEGMLIVSDPDNGKSHILRKAYHQVLAHDWPQESERLLIPALYIQAPPHADRGDLFRDIAEKLHVPAWDRIPYSILRTQTRKYIRDAGVKVIFVDELHNLIAGGENSKRTILDDLRYFSNEFATPLITAGTERAFAAISSDKQYKSRLKATLLPEWSSSDFVGLMRALEQVFTLPTGDLTRREICQSVWEYCHRKIGPCIHLVNLAVRASRIQGGAPITPELLTAVIAEEAVYEGPKSV